MTTNTKALKANHVQSASDLVSQLYQYPQEWCYVPVGGNKIPWGKDWDKKRYKADDFKKALTEKLFSDLVYQPKGTSGADDLRPVPMAWMKGVGVLCGTPSGGLLCVDRDGASSDELVVKLSGMPIEEALPISPTVTSGKPGRCQMLYQVPEMYWDVITSKVILTGVKTWNDFKSRDEDEQLDLRWDGRQSVILGAHPETGSYRWVEGRSPLDVPVAEAPLWMIEQMLQEEPQPAPQPAKKSSFAPLLDTTWGDREWADSYANAIDVSALDWHQWRDCLLALNHAGYTESEARSWSASSTKHTDQGFADVWNYIDGSIKPKGVGTLGLVAKQHGWVSPFPKKTEGDRPETVKELNDKKISMDAIAEKYLKFREQIMVALQIPNQSQKEFALEEIAINFRKSKEFMKRLLDELEARRKPVSDEEEFVDVVDLLNAPMEGMQYLIDDFIPRGESILLTAKAKVGKSLLAYEAAYAVASGSNFLNKQAHQGRVLIIQTEEGKVELHKRLNTRGFDALPRNQVHTLRRFKVHRDIPKLEAKLAEFRPSLVIIDSLRKISAGSGVDENKAEFANPVYEIADIVRGYGASCIFIHHDKKDKEAQGIDAGAGTSALPGAVWGIWRLLRTGQNEDSPERHLSITVRGDRGTRHLIRLTEGEACSWAWEWKSELNGDPECTEWENKILSVLSKNQRELSLREINELCLLPHGDRKLYRPINNLIKRCRVTVRKDAGNSRLFWYSLPGVTHTLPPESADVCNQDGARVAQVAPDFCDSTDRGDSYSPSLDLNKESKEFSNTEIESNPLSAIPDQKNEAIACNPVTPMVAQVGGIKGECVSKAEERRSPWTESNGVVQWRTDAKPVKKLTRLKGTLQSCIATTEGMFEVGGTVTTSEIPSGVFQIERLTSTHAQLSMGHIVAVESLKPVGVRS